MEMPITPHTFFVDELSQQFLGRVTIKSLLTWRVFVSWLSRAGYLRLFVIEVYMLPLLHPLRRYVGLVSIIAPLSTSSSILVLARKSNHSHPSTSVSARSLGSRSQRSPVMSSLKSPNLPRGAWDSHVHVVDEVSNVVWAVLLSQ